MRKKIVRLIVRMKELIDRRTRWQQVPEPELEPVALGAISMSTVVRGTDE
jgi:hypothetical protein